MVTLNFDGEIKEVRLIEQIQFRGEIAGRVLDGAGTSVVAGISVPLSSSDVLATTRTVTTGPDGRFSFPDTVPGPFSLAALDPVTHFVSLRSATLPHQTWTFAIDIPLVPVAALAGTIYRPDGLTPATNGSVHFNGLWVDTGERGRGAVTRLPLGTHALLPKVRTPEETRSVRLP